MRVFGPLGSNNVSPCMCVEFGDGRSRRALHRSAELPVSANYTAIRTLCWVHAHSEAVDPEVPEGSLAGICWVGFWGLGGPWGL